MKFPLIFSPLQGSKMALNIWEFEVTHSFPATFKKNFMAVLLSVTGRINLIKIILLPKILFKFKTSQF